MPPSEYTLALRLMNETAKVSPRMRRGSQILTETRICLPNTGKTLRYYCDLVSLGKHSDITVTSLQTIKYFRVTILLKMYESCPSHACHPYGVSYFSQLLHVCMYFATLITKTFWFNNFSQKSYTIFCAKPLEDGSTGEAVYWSHFQGN